MEWILAASYTKMGMLALLAQLMLQTVEQDNSQHLPTTQMVFLPRKQEQVSMNILQMTSSSILMKIRLLLKKMEEQLVVLLITTLQQTEQANS